MVQPSQLTWMATRDASVYMYFKQVVGALVGGLQTNQFVNVTHTCAAWGYITIACYKVARLQLAGVVNTLPLAVECINVVMV